MELDFTFQVPPQVGSNMVFTNDFQLQQPIQSQQVLQNQQAFQNQQVPLNDTAVQNEQPVLNQQTAHNEQNTPNEQASWHEQAIEQPAQEHQGGPRPVEGEPAQQVLAGDDNDLFGDREYYEMLGPIREFNSRN